MSKNKNAPEMFEAFHRMGRSAPPAEAPRKPVEPRIQPPAAAIPRPAPQAVPPVNLLRAADSTKTHLFPLGRRAEVVFAFSYNALIVATVVLVFVLAFAGYVGYRLGAGKTTAGQPVAKEEGKLPVYQGDADGGNRTGQGEGVGTASTSKRYRVLVVSYANRASSQSYINRTLEFLRSKNIPDILTRPSSDKKAIGIFAGSFSDQAQAERLAERIRELEFQNKKQFKGAGVFQIEE